MQRNPNPESKALSWRSKLVHSDVSVPGGFRSLVTPTYRGSTTILSTAADVSDDWDQRSAAYRYGLYGTPTTLELGARLAELQDARHCFITPCGQSAITLIYLALTTTGGHVLVPDSVYGPSRHFGDRFLRGWGIEVEYYDPNVGQDIERLCRENTQLIWCESPGSITMEIQDVPAIAAAARRRGIVSALDDTYSAGVLFRAFSHGIDVTVQALTKYIGGHSDILLGSVSVNSESLYQRIGDAHQLIGMSASPDDCSLALRGLQTLGVRLAQLEDSALAVARWLGDQPEVQQVLHPALPSCPGHDLWKRDFAGSASVFSVIFGEEIGREWIIRFIDQLQLFKLGFSWGGVTSLVMRYEDIERKIAVPAERLVRFNIGLEDAQDLIGDLAAAFAAQRASGL